MAAASGPGHTAPTVPGLALGGPNSSAALPAIGLAGFGGGHGGGTSPLGRERSGMNAPGGLPRKEASYASSTASKISIASLPLDALEHIIEGFKAQQQQQQQGGKQPPYGNGGAGGVRFDGGAGGGGGRGSVGGAPHSVRINLSPAPAAPPPAGGGGGRTAGRTWNVSGAAGPAAGGGGGAAGGVGGGPGGGRRLPGGAGSVSFTFRPGTPPNAGGGGGADTAVAAAPVPPVWPGLPPGAVPPALSSRAAAVLQGSDSAAHLQRFLALDSGQLENHFIIASPSGAPVTDLQEVCFDGAASIDGLPTGRDVVVVLTNTPEGVPVPRVIPLDQPGPNSLRRTGMTAVLAASGTSLSGMAAGHTSSSGGGSGSGPYMYDTADGTMRSTGSSGSLLAAAQSSLMEVAAEGSGGDTGAGDVHAAASPMRSPHPAALPSPQRSSAVTLERSSGGGAGLYSVSPRGTASQIASGAAPTRRSDTGMASRASASNRQQPTPPPSAPLPSASSRATPASPVAVHSHQNHHHHTSTYNMLPALPDGAAAPFAGGSGAAAAAAALAAAAGASSGSGRSSIPPPCPVSSTGTGFVGGGGGGGSRQRRGSNEPLPSLVRMSSPEHRPSQYAGGLLSSSGGTTTAGASMTSRDGGDGDVLEVTPGDLPGSHGGGGGSGGGGTMTMSSSSAPPSVAGPSTTVSPRQWPSGVMFGGGGGAGEAPMSPTRTRLQARINNLQTERERNNQQMPGAGGPGGGAGGAAGSKGGGGPLGAAFGPTRSLVLSNLSGMDLVRAALKQVETGERTLADPRVRISTSDSESRRTSRSSATGSGAPPSGAAGTVGTAVMTAAEAAEAQRQRELREQEEREAAAAAERRQARLVRSLTKLLTTGRGRTRPSTAHSLAGDSFLLGPSAPNSRKAIRLTGQSQKPLASHPGLATSPIQSSDGSALSALSSPPQQPPQPSPRGKHTDPQQQQQGAAAQPQQPSQSRSPRPSSATSLPPRPPSGSHSYSSPNHSHSGGSRPGSATLAPAGAAAPSSTTVERPTDGVAVVGSLSGGGEANGEVSEGGEQKQRKRAPAGKDAVTATVKAAAATAAAGPADVVLATGRCQAEGDEDDAEADDQTGAGDEEDEEEEEEGDDSLDAAAAGAADGGLDADALVQFAQQLDRANMEFRLVEAARERTRRVEALLNQAALTQQLQQQQQRGRGAGQARRRSSITGDPSSIAAAAAAGDGGGGGGGPRVGSPDRQTAGGAVQGLDLHLLARRREGTKPHNVTQVISSLEAPLDRPMEVDLEALLSSIGEALQADEADVQATRFDENFRIRTERYLAQLCRLNPAAFEEVSAAQAEADYRSSVERAKLRLRQLHGEVAGEPLTSAGKPKNQYDKAVVMLQAHRPFFLPPVMSREAVERAPVPPMLGSRGFTRPPWDVYSSIFRERKRSDARDLYDTDAVLSSQFQLDWSRTVSKMLFMKLVAREDLGVRMVRGKNGRAALEQELSQVREALASHFPMIRSAFTYYSIATPEEVYTAAVSAAVAAASASGGRAEAAAAEVAAAAAAAAVRRGGGGNHGTSSSLTPSSSLNSMSGASRPTEVPSVAESTAAAAAAAASAAAEADGSCGPDGGGGSGYGILEMDEQRWLAFCTSAGITGRTPGVRVADTRLLFWTVNREEERNMTLESVENNDNAFMRFEFMEALVRAAFGRYITPGTLRDASDATRRLMAHLRAALPPLALVDPNEFRRTRLYTPEMEVAVVHNLELITASFKLYKARDRAKYLGVDHWMSLLETNNLLGAPHMGAVTPTEARLIFAWSQMVVVDELKLRRRAVSLQLWDFVEAVARLAERISLPPTDEMDRWMLYNLNIGRNTPLPPGHTRVWTYCSALAHGRGGPGLERRPSGRELLPSPAPAGCPPTRPLAAKFRLLMEYLAGSLAVAWGGNNTHETAQSMMRTANMLCGGVELA